MPSRPKHSRAHRLPKQPKLHNPPLPPLTIPPPEPLLDDIDLELLDELHTKSVSEAPTFTQTVNPDLVPAQKHPGLTALHLTAADMAFEAKQAQVKDRDAPEDAARDKEHARLLQRSAKGVGNSGRIPKAVRQAKAVDLRAHGYGYRAIADELGVSTKTAYYDVQEGLRYVTQYERRVADDHRAMMVRRCELIYTKLSPNVDRGDTFSVMAMVKTMEFQARLQGLEIKVEDAPAGNRPLRQVTRDDLLSLVQTLKDTEPEPLQLGDGQVIDADPV